MDHGSWVMAHGPWLMAQMHYMLLIDPKTKVNHKVGKLHKKRKKYRSKTEKVTLWTSREYYRKMNFSLLETSQLCNYEID